MERAFEINSIESLEKNVYKLGGRALRELTKNSVLRSSDENASLEIKEMRYYGRLVDFIDPLFTCYLIIQTNDEFSRENKYLNLYADSF